MLSEEHAALIPEDIRSDPGLQPFNDFGGIAKSYLDTKALVGRSIQLPGKDSKPEDVDRWAGETGGKLKEHGFTVTKLSDIPAGAPASPDAYEFKIEGVEPDVVKADPVITSFRAFAHSKGLDNDKANGLVNWYMKDVVPMMQKAGEANGVEMIEGEEKIGKILEDRFKGETVARRTEYDRGVLALSQAIPDLKDFLEGTAPFGKSWIPNSGHPAMVQLISEVGRMTGQDFGGNVSSSGGPIDQSALSEAKDIQSNPNNAKYQLYRSGDRATVDHVNALYEKAHGKGEVNPNDWAPKLKVG